MNKLKALPIVAAMLGDKLAVKVVIGGNETAKTDGSTIYLPALPMDAEEELVGLVNGYIDHEAAHIRHTDFDVLGSCSTPVLKHITNTLEDYRIEHEIIKRYPGCQQHFKWLIRNRFLNDHNKIDANNPDSFLILDYILLSLRAMDVPELATKCSEIKGILDGHWNGLTDKLSCIISTVPSACNSTDDCKQYAEKIMSIIEKYNKKEYDITDDPVLSPSATDTQYAPDAHEKDDTSSNNEQTVQTHNQNLKGILQKLLDAGEDELPATFDNNIAESIHGLSGQYGAAVEVAVESTMHISTLPEKCVQDALRASMGISTKLTALLQSTVLKRSCPSRSGKIDGRTLYKVKTADPYLFKRHEEKPGIDTAVHILLDASGSMHNTIVVACSACYACSLALSRIPGVSVGVTAFPADSRGDNANTIFPLLKHGERVTRKMCVGASGSTPMAQALLWCLKTLLSLNQKRKTLLVISDGDPDDFQMAETSIQALMYNGIEVLGIGIGRNQIQKLFNNSRTITCVDELSGCVLSMLQESMIMCGGRQYA